MAKQGPNKTKFWRKKAEKYVDENNVIKRTGRALKRAMNGQNHPGILLPLHVSLFKRAGISTPVLDKAQEVSNNIKMQSETISDAEIINEGELSVA